MPKRPVYLLLQIIVAALVLLSYAALATTEQYGPVIMFLPLAALLIMPLCEQLDRKTEWYKRFTTSITAAVALSLPVVFTTFDPLTAVTLLVIYIQLYTLFHDKTERNYNHLVLMSFFLLLAASVMTPSPSIGLVFFLFLIITAIFFILLELFAAEHRSGRNESLSVMGLHERERLVPSEPMPLFDRHLNGWLFAAAMGTVVVTVLFFFMTPRLEAGVFGREQAGTFTTGLSREIDLSAGGTIQRDTQAVMHVVFPQRPEGMYGKEMYWRVTTLDEYQNGSWRRSGLRTQPNSGYGRNDSFRLFSSLSGWDTPEGITRPTFNENPTLIEQHIFLAQAPDKGLPALPMVRTIMPMEDQSNFRFQWERSGDYTVTTARDTGPGIQYRAWSEPVIPSSDELNDLSPDYLRHMVSQDYRLLTAHELLPITQELAEEITKDAATPFQKAVAIERWLTAGDFDYTLNLPPLPPDHPIDAFIHDTKTGHCELFASAMALMLRSVDVPARLATGYRGGAYDPSDESYTVSADTAHVWVEVFFPQYGWVQFDPSPPSPEFDGIGLGAIQRAFSLYTLRSKMFWYRNVVGFTPRNRLEILRDATLGIFGNDKQDQPATDDIAAVPADSSSALSPLVPILLIAGLLLAGLVWFGWHARQNGRRHIFLLTQDQARAVALRKKLVSRLRARGVDAEGKTVEDLRDIVAASNWDDRDLILQILGAYNAVRFGQRPLSAPVFTRLRQMLQNVKPLRRAAVSG